MDEIELNDIADNLLIINQETIERLFKEDNKDTLVLYLFYYKTAKWQKHNPIKATDDYTKKCLHWGINRVKAIKKRLKDMELIEVEKRINDKQQIDGWYIKVNYYQASGTNSSSTKSPLVEKQCDKILLDNNINTNNNINTKEIYKESWDCEEYVKDLTIAEIGYLNDKTGRNFREDNPKTISLIRARLRDGYRAIDIMRVIDTKCDEWLDTDMEKYLRPETLFGTKFENYLNQRRTNDKRRI